MIRLKRLAVAGVILAAVTGAILMASSLLFTAVMEFGMCVNEVVATVSSPDRRHRAVVFQRDCGATTDFSTQVTLDPLIASRPIGGGNVWIADADHDVAPRAKWGGPDVRLEWTSPSSLRLLYHPKARIFLAETRVAGVEIVYGYLGEDNRIPNKRLERPSTSARGDVAGSQVRTTVVPLRYSTAETTELRSSSRHNVERQGRNSHFVGSRWRHKRSTRPMWPDPARAA